MRKKYDIFISYSQKDGDVAGSLASKFDESGLRCFMADRSILAAAEWEPQLREAMLASEIVLLLMTPRSKGSLWVAAEAGAAWVLQKQLIPVLMFVDPQDLFDPIRKYQARVAETTEQISALVNELKQIFFPRDSPRDGLVRVSRGTDQVRSENFTTPAGWDALLKIGEWMIDANSRFILGEEMYRYLLSHNAYGPEPFTVNCRMSFLELRASVGSVNAGIVLGWSTPESTRQYLHLMFTGERLLLESVGFRGGSEYHDFQHVDEGVPFTLQPSRPYEINLLISEDVLEVQIDDHDVYRVRLPRTMLSGRVGLRPWRSLMRCDLFEVTSEDY